MSYNGGQVWCVAHCDLDGNTAAAVVKQQHPDCNVIITNYNKPLHLSKFKPGDLIYVVDFSLPKDIFEILKGRNCEIIWIDHHKSAIEGLRGTIADTFKGIRTEEYSGAMLTWMYFNPDKTFEQSPIFIQLVNWYDLWQHDKDPRVRAFAYGIGLWETRPGYVAGDKLWNTLFSNNGDKFFENIVKYGQDVIRYIEKYQDTVCADLAYRTTLNVNGNNRNILAMVARTGNSSIFERQDMTNVDALFTGQYIASVKQYRCSVYSPDNKKVVLDIAQMFGGGGHPTAAGFTYPRYPINLPSKSQPKPLADVIKSYEEVKTLRESSPILKRYVDKSSVVTSKVSGWHDVFCGYNAIVFNHPYIPDMLHLLPLNVDCVNQETGTVADIYIGYVMTNSGYYRCCAYPTSTSVKVEDMLQRIQQTYMPKVTDICNKMEMINGGIWWYQEEEPVQPQIAINTSCF